MKPTKTITRPTSSKVRQALFNIWQGNLENTSYLDLCAGTGAIGAQALLEGAKEVVGIEINRHACLKIQQSWQKISSLEQSFRVIQGDILSKIHILKNQKFDFIYFDPPYQSGLYESVLELIILLNLLDEYSELAVEHNPKFWQAPPSLNSLSMIRQKQYGDTFLSFFVLS